MPFKPHPKRAEFEERIAKGEDPQDVGRAIGVHRETVRLWLKPKPQGTAGPNDGEQSTTPNAEAPEGVNAPLSGAKERTTQRTTAKRTPAKAITEATAEKLVEGCFMVAAVMTREELWLLEDFERKSLGPALADSLALVPAPIANAVNAYAGPTVFFTTLFGIINAKNNAIRRKRGALAAAQRNGQGVSAAQRVDMSRTTTPPPTSAAQAAEAAAAQTTTVQPRMVAVDMDLATAVAASKAGLRDEDDADEAERHLTGV